MRQTSCVRKYLVCVEIKEGRDDVISIVRLDHMLNIVRMFDFEFGAVVVDVDHIDVDEARGAKRRLSIVSGMHNIMVPACCAGCINVSRIVGVQINDAAQRVDTKWRNGVAAQAHQTVNDERVVVHVRILGMDPSNFLVCVFILTDGEIVNRPGKIWYVVVDVVDDQFDFRTGRQTG